MKKTYRKLTTHFKIPDTCCTSNEWYLKYIVSELTIQYLIFHDNNAKGEKLDKDLHFPDWNCWDYFYNSIEKHLLEDKMTGLNIRMAHSFIVENILENL